MKKSIFNRKLFFDSLRQLKTVGIMATVVLGAFGILIPAGEYISSYRFSYIEDGVRFTEKVTSQVSSLDIQPLIILSYTVIAPLVTLVMFSFLNKRNSSDFFHSIPLKRETVFFSMFAACISWVAVALVVSTLTSALTAVILGDYFIVNFATVFVSLFTTLAASYMVAAAVSLAMSITGTTFNNVFVSLMILFIPRIFFHAIKSIVMLDIPFIVENAETGFLGSQTANISFGTLTALGMGLNNFEAMIYDFRSGIYAVVLGTVYLALAVYGFKKRKSEAAGNAAATKKLSVIYRTVLAAALSLIPCAIIFDCAIGETAFNASTLFTICVLYFIVALAYAIYELISSKKLSAMARSLPGLLIVAVLNLVILGTIFGARAYSMNFAPDADSIDYVSISELSEGYNDYFTARASKIKITDKTAVKIISDALKKEVELCKNDSSNYYEFRSKGDRRDIPFKIKAGLRSEVREIVLTGDEYAYVFGTLESSDTFKDMFKDLPEKNLNVDIYTSSIGYIDLNKKDAERIYLAFREDIQKASAADAYDIINSRSYDTGICNIDLSFAYGLENYSLDLQVTKKTPRAAKVAEEVLYEYLKLEQPAVIAELEKLGKVDKAPESDIWLQLCISNSEREGTEYINVPAYDAELLGDLAAFLKDCKDNTPSVDRAHIDVRLELQWNNKNDHSEYTARFILPSKKMPELLHRMLSNVYDEKIIY